MKLDKDIKMNGNDMTTSSIISNSRRQYTCMWRMKEEGCSNTKGGEKGEGEFQVETD